MERAARLRHAEKLVRQGALAAAVAEYRGLIDEQPGDWNTTNALGDLYLRAGQLAQAVDQFTRSADSLEREGFLPKAAALYKKILKIAPDAEHAMMKSADIALAQGLSVDARHYLAAARSRRLARGDETGLAEVDVRLAVLAPDDVEARYAGARARVRLGDVHGAVADFKSLAADLSGKDRRREALQVMQEAAPLAPQDPDLCLGLMEVCLREGRIDAALDVVDAVLRAGPDRWLSIARLIGALGDDAGEGGRQVTMRVADHAGAREDWSAAVAVLEDFQARFPGDVASLRRLVDVAGAAGIEDLGIGARDRLVDALLAAGELPEAQRVVEELLSLQPGEVRHLTRLAQARAMSGDIGQLEIEEVEEVEIDLDLDLDMDGGSGGEASRDDRQGDGPFWSGESLWIGASGESEAAVRDARSSAPAAAPLPDAPALPMDMDSVFAGLRSEASRQLIVDVAEQEYGRGMALFNDGQLDDAIVALEIASRAPRRRFETAAMLGRIHHSRGDLAQAIDWWERAREAPAPTASAEHRVSYELADALESIGETARALAICLGLQAELGEYRDLAARIERLARAESGG